MFGLGAVLISIVVSATAAGAAIYYLLRQNRLSIPGLSGSDTEARFLFQGRELLNASGGGAWLFETAAGTPGDDWGQLRKILAPRFPGIPEYPEEMDADILTCPTNLPNDEAELLLERINNLTRITVLQPGEGLVQPADIHRKLLSDRRVETLERAVDDSPYPIWSTDTEGRVIWANNAYIQLAENVGIQDTHAIPHLFDIPETPPPASPRTRLSLTLEESDSNIWFDVISSDRRAVQMHYAIDINAVVQAEIAQRNFVQTLTKTFAQLSIGLVIFDRKRQLALFNPALIDLLGLSPEFLSSRPTLIGFFDRLRDLQIMPEPKCYSSWREELTELVTAASDGGYLDTWNLPTGLTYRVSGRPHPDGAVAFLFEDITSEVSLTRRFRAQLDTMEALIDGFPHAVAVFSEAGILTFANAAYRSLWHYDPDSSFSDMTLEDARHHWRKNTAPGADLSCIGPGQTSPLSLPLRNGRQITCKAEPLNGGGFAMVFTDRQSDKHFPILRLPA